MARSRRLESPNPFVALADVTISLAFIVLVFALSAIMRSGSALLDINRQERQDAVRASLVDELRREGYSGAVALPIKETHNPEGALTRRYQDVFEKPGGSLLARVDENASFQRVRLMRRCFVPKTSILTEEGRRLYRAVGHAISQNRDRLEYVYFHGVVNDVPGRSDPSEDRLSRERAQAVFQRLQNEGAIQTPEELRAGGGSTPGKVDLKYAMWYGTGDYLYAEHVGDEYVDVLVFYTDRGASR